MTQSPPAAQRHPFRRRPSELQPATRGDITAVINAIDEIRRLLEDIRGLATGEHRRLAMRMIRRPEGGIVDLGSMLNPEYLFVAQAKHPTEAAGHLSIHLSEDGGRQRIAQIAETWCVTIDQLDFSIIESPLEP